MHFNRLRIVVWYTQSGSESVHCSKKEGGGAVTVDVRYRRRGCRGRGQTRILGMFVVLLG